MSWDVKKEEERIGERREEDGGEERGLEGGTKGWKVKEKRGVTKMFTSFLFKARQIFEINSETTKTT